MVANLSSHKRGWDDRWEEFSNIAEKGQKHIKKLLELVDKDTESFNQIMHAFRLPEVTQKKNKLKKLQLKKLPFMRSSSFRNNENIIRINGRNHGNGKKWKSKLC